jgi:hypothetical protein
LKIVKDAIASEQRNSQFSILHFQFLSTVGSGAIFSGQHGARLTPSPRSLGLLAPLTGLRHRLLLAVLYHGD